MRLIWDDDDYVAAWEELIAAGSVQPNADLAARVGISKGAVAQRMRRLRLSGRIMQDGNEVRFLNARGCPYCGASPSRQRPERALGDRLPA